MLQPAKMWEHFAKVILVIGTQIFIGGDIMLVVDLDLQTNTTAYNYNSFPFFIAEVIGPNNREELLVQIMRPSDLVSIKMSFFVGKVTTTCCGYQLFWKVWCS